MPNFLLERVKLYRWLGVFVCIFFIIFLRLGVWQLARADEKQALLAVYQQQQQMPAQTLTFYAGELEQYQRIQAYGSFDEQRYWLLDNQSRDGQVGYEVIMPFVVGDKILLVNRGWVVGPPTRDTLPDISTSIESMMVTGYLVNPPTNAIFKQTESDWLETWPKRVLHIDTDIVSSQLGLPVYPLVLRLDDESPQSLFTQWPVVSTQPEKHEAYAVQWFAMACVLLIVYSAIIFRKEVEIIDET